MEILFHRYGSICEPDILHVFRKFGITVVEDDMEITQKNIQGDVRIETLLSFTKEHTFSFVFSINFFPYLSEFCNLVKIPYVCWSVDSPVLELFSKSIRNEYNRIFLFDYSQYERFHPQNPECIFYLPLAANVDRWDDVIDGITPADQEKYTADISFVGSLYQEKSPLDRLNNIPEYIKGYVDALIEAQLQVYGSCFLEESLTEDIVAGLKQADPGFLSLPDSYENTDRFVAANHYIGLQLAFRERVRTLNLLSNYYEAALYTRSDTACLPKIRAMGGVQTLTEMPKVFHLSRINLNITMRPIQTGLSLRVWDILGCGGFLLTNYQAEIPEYFETGKDLETYSSMEELLYKTEYYLAHEDERREIARNGYEKVRKFHTYEQRITDMLRVITGLMEKI